MSEKKELVHPEFGKILYEENLFESMGKDGRIGLGVIIGLVVISLIITGIMSGDSFMKLFDILLIGLLCLSPPIIVLIIYLVVFSKRRTIIYEKGLVKGGCEISFANIKEYYYEAKLIIVNLVVPNTYITLILIDNDGKIISLKKAGLTEISPYSLVMDGIIKVISEILLSKCLEDLKIGNTISFGVIKLNARDIILEDKHIIGIENLERFEIKQGSFIIYFKSRKPVSYLLKTISNYHVLYSMLNMFLKSKQ